MLFLKIERGTMESQTLSSSVLNEQNAWSIPDSKMFEICAQIGSKLDQILIIKS